MDGISNQVSPTSFASSKLYAHIDILETIHLLWLKRMTTQIMLSAFPFSIVLIVSLFATSSTSCTEGKIHTIVKLSLIGQTHA